MTMRSAFQTAWLGVLPALCMPAGPNAVFTVGLPILLFFWITLFFFETCRPLFPARVFEFSIALWLLTGAQTALYLFGAAPFWALAVLILLTPFPARGRRFWERPHLDKSEIARGVWFLILFAAVRFVLDTLPSGWNQSAAPFAAALTLALLAAIFLLLTGRRHA